MNVTHQNNTFTITTATYSLICPEDRPFVDLYDHAGQRFAELFVASSVHTQAGQDDTTELAGWEIEQNADSVTLTRHAQSNIWRNKRFRFHLYEERLTYEVEVEGSDTVTSVDYFGGYCSAQPRWGSGYFWSGQAFKQGFNPEPFMDEVFTFAPASSSVIDLTGVPIPNKGSWFFTPPPFCFAFKIADGWIGMGVEARPGENRYCEFGYRGQRDAFTLTIDYAGYLNIAGTYTLPVIGIDFAADPYAAVARHAEALRKQNNAPTVVRPKPAWWHQPIFCGWGAQCGLARVGAKRAPEYTRHEYYEGFMNTLKAHGITPGTVVIDDKWQESYGENAVDPAKWHDLPGFIAQQHEAGRKVLLWLKAWDPEGLPADECVTNNAGVIVAADLTNPVYERRLRAAVERMLSPQGYDADGFKIDFTARISASHGLHRANDVWGLELMRRYLGIVYTEAKRVKPDALMIAHTPHPYLADVVDMVRLNDINIGKDINAAMQHRAHIAKLACPSALIDTDNWPITDLAAWRRYLPLQIELGVPALYCVSEIDTTGEPLEEADYALVRKLWAEYRASIGVQQ